MAKAKVEPTRLMRSLLFVPGADARKLERSRDGAADGLILDLEDSVAPEKKEEARRLVAESIGAGRFGGATIAVRINPPGSTWFEADLESVLEAGVQAIMLSKCESAPLIAELGERLGGRAKLLALVETPRGVVDCAAIAGASRSVEALCFGPADFSLAMGLGETDVSRGVIYHARCTLVIAARATGVAAIDCVHLSVKDEGAFREDAVLGRSLGYEGKLCIHPRQVEIANAVYTPTRGEIDYALRVVEAWDRAAAEARGVFALDGRMIDAPVVEAQRKVLERAQAAGAL